MVSGKSVERHRDLLLSLSKARKVGDKKKLISNLKTPALNFLLSIVRQTLLDKIPLRHEKRDLRRLNEHRDQLNDFIQNHPNYRGYKK